MFATGLITATASLRMISIQIAEQVSSSLPQVAASTVCKVLMQKRLVTAAACHASFLRGGLAGFVGTCGFARAYTNLHCYSLDSGMHIAGSIACRTGGIRLTRHAALA